MPKHGQWETIDSILVSEVNPMLICSQVAGWGLQLFQRKMNATFTVIKNEKEKK